MNEMDGLISVLFKSVLFVSYDDCPAANLNRLFFCR